MKHNNEERKIEIQKIIYFDEESVTDYVQIVEGGNLEKTTELLNETENQFNAQIKSSASAGISKVFKAILGLESKIEANLELGATLNTNKMAKNILKNTILTDFINILKKDNSNIKNFKDYKIFVEEDSLSYIVMISPYMTMLGKSNSVKAGEFDLFIDKIDNAVKAGKGYFEFIGEKDKEKVVLRFNINAFKNNYKISDLLKMDLSVYAIKVGRTTLEKLDINNELNLNKKIIISKDNPSYVGEGNGNSGEEESEKELDVYDVLLAGVEKK
ncbi:MAG: hypothetical protein J6A89_05485 [Clostridia bacterium]|nr:hypothetical protein [Clostridia bacterium]